MRSDDVERLLGQRAGRHHRHLRSLAIGTVVATSLLLVPAVAWALNPHDHVARAAALTAATFWVVLQTISLSATWRFARDVGRSFGYTTWWCLVHVPTAPAHLIQWLEDEVVMRDGASQPPADPARVEALDFEDRMQSLSRNMQRTSLKYQAMALALSLVAFGTALYRQWEYTPLPGDVTQSNSPVGGPSGIDAQGRDPLLRALGCNGVPTVKSSQGTETGDAFSCTTSDGGTALFAYFATPQQAIDWVRSELRSEHRPLGDAVLGDQWAAICTDPAVLLRLRAAAGR